ncbi:MAG: glycosyltransferase family 2 protein [Syntrophobacterales bacterium]|nr:glycosyltransferase family 2 protein [Syntrophobacterales bacterium]
MTEHRDCIIKDICAVVVSYFPDSNFPERIRKIAEQVGKVIIVDNGSDIETIEVLNKLSLQSRIQPILNSENLGVATALNQGVWWAQGHGFRWVLLFDHDTTPEKTMTEELLSVYTKFPCQEKLAIVGSNYYNAYNHCPLYNMDVDSCRWMRKTVITSGSLLSLRAFNTIGPFRDEFFIDLVDFEYCLRTRAKGYYVTITSKPIMEHRLGEVEVHRLLWRKVGTSNHSALRRYYMTRNYILLAKEYASSEQAWVLVTLFHFLKSIILMILLEKNRRTKLRNVILGIWHGILGKIGINENL